jgi:hypothetical protein
MLPPGVEGVPIARVGGPIEDIRDGSSTMLGEPSTSSESSMKMNGEKTMLSKKYCPDTI